MLRRAIARDVARRGVRARGFEARRAGGGAHAHRQGRVGVVRWDHRGARESRRSRGVLSFSLCVARGVDGEGVAPVDGRMVRGTARGWEGRAGARRTRDANGARTRDCVERLTMTRASDVCACLFLHRHVVCNPWTW